MKGALDKLIINRARKRIEAVRNALGPDPDIILGIAFLYFPHRRSNDR